MPKRPYPKWQRRHEGVLLWLLEHPWAKLQDCARATGYSPSQISRIACSPEFRLRYTAALKTAQQSAFLEGMTKADSPATDRRD
jgi:hypothetical protein